MRLVDMYLGTAVLATLATVMMVGLGFLRNPTRATRWWSLAFMVIMVGSYGVIAAEVLGSPTLRGVAQSVILVGPTLIWSGVRTKLDRSSLAWVGLVQGVATAGILILLSPTPWYALGFQVVFATSSVFAALTVADLVNGPQRGLGMLLPLTLVSAVFPMLALINLIVGLRAATEQTGGLGQNLTSNVLAAPVYLVCAIVSLLYLGAAEVDGRVPGGRRSARRLLSDRLARAEAAREPSWSMLYISFDDVADVRLAVGDAAFEDIVDRFAAHIRSAFPAEADIEFRSDTVALVLLTRPEATIRTSIRSMLNDISTFRADQPLAVQFSASVGWATTDAVGYDFDVLSDAARVAAVDARLEGGDRWVRVEPDPARL